MPPITPRCQHHLDVGLSPYTIASRSGQAVVGCLESTQSHGSSTGKRETMAPHLVERQTCAM
eukprot:scaffold186645_cov35-Tisochrysis_lutea.AAC.2